MIEQRSLGKASIAGGFVLTVSKVRGIGVVFYLKNGPGHDEIINRPHPTVATSHFGHPILHCGRTPTLLSSSHLRPLHKSSLSTLLGIKLNLHQTLSQPRLPSQEHRFCTRQQVFTNRLDTANDSQLLSVQQQQQQHHIIKSFYSSSHQAPPTPALCNSLDYLSIASLLYSTSGLYEQT